MTTRTRLDRALDIVAVLTAITSAVTIVSVAVLLVGILKPKVQATNPAAPPTTSSRTADISGLETTGHLQQTRGNGAKLVLLEFSDFQCPFCGRYARDTFNKITSEFVERGLIDYSFRSFPLPSHPFAEKAAEALACAGRQSKYWEMHDRIFANQQQLGEAALVANAVGLGLDERTFRACVNGKAEADVKADRAEGERLGVTATPTFLLGIQQRDGTIKLLRKIEGAQPFEVFRDAIRSVLPQARASL